MSLSEILPRILKPETVVAAFSALRRRTDEDEDQFAQRLDQLSVQTDCRLPRRGYFKG